MEGSILEIKILKSYKELSSIVADIVKRQLKKQPLSKLALPTVIHHLVCMTNLLKEN